MEKHKAHYEQRMENDAGQYHRLDGPAIIGADGRLEWCVNGERHRVNGPAVIKRFCTQWWVDGKLHRLDGPAHVGANGDRWYVNGNLLKTEDIENWMKEDNIPLDYALWNDAHIILFRLRF